MKVSLFKREKVENSLDLASLFVQVGKREVSLETLINEAHEMQKPEHMANGDHMVAVGDSKMSVNDLAAKYNAACAELAELKKPKENDDVVAENDIVSDDEEAKKAALKLAEHEEKEIVEAKANDEDEEKKKKEKEEAEEKKANAIAKAARLKNAPSEAHKLEAVVDLPMDQVARGKTRYGS